MAEQTKTVTFDTDYQGAQFISPKVAFGPGPTGIVLSVIGEPVELNAHELETLGVNLIAAAELLRSEARQGGTTDG